MKKICPVFLFVFFMTLSVSAQQIIIHPENSLTEISKKNLKRIYMLKQKTWPGGTPVLPVDLKKGNPVRDSFSQKNCGKSVGDMERHYLKRALSGKGQPPKVFATEKEIIDFVASNKGAIGYVSKPDSSVKTIPVK